MATMEEILASVGLGDEASEGQTKTASAAPSSDEVNDVLEGLGLSGVDVTGQTKTASEERNNMGLTNIYEDLFSAEAEGEGQEKTASEEGGEGYEQVEDGEGSPSNDLGELTGIYFNIMREELMDKLAGDLQAEAGAGHAPLMDHAGGELSRIVGKEGDPRIRNNHGQSEAGLKVTTGNQTPYSLKAQAQAKHILKRTMKASPGDVGGYNE
jgi:hypothetical protein